MTRHMDGLGMDTWFTRLTARTDARLTGMGVSGTFARDCLFAVLMALGSSLLLWALLALLESEDGIRFSPLHLAVVMVLTGAQSLALCVRRVNPVACLAVTTVLQVALVAVLPATVSYSGIASLIAAYTCGTRLPARPMVGVVAAVAVFESVAGLLIALTLSGLTVSLPDIAAASAPDDALALALNRFATSALATALAAFTGAYVATRRRYSDLVRVRAAEAVQAQRERADSAINAERSRMARELHDIAAHHLSGMVVQAAAVERLIGRDDQAAREATAWIRGQGKETLDNLRLVVGTLREPARSGLSGAVVAGGAGGLGGDAAPVPGLAVLDRLVQAVRDLGTPVEVLREGEPYDLAPIADVTFYRVVQEALSNAREHAPGASARLLLRWTPATVSVEVVTEAARGGARLTGPAPDHGGGTAPPDAPRGLGLIGMRERAQLIGATFEAGPTASGAWRVSLALAVGRATMGDSADTGKSGPA